MGRFAESNPLLDAVVDVIADRAEDFDREVIEDLIEAVGEDDIWLACVGPAINAVMTRIGLDRFIESSSTPLESHHMVTSVDVGGEQGGTIGVAMCTCPHCKMQFGATMMQIANGEAECCPHCGKKIVPGGKIVPGEPGPEGMEGGP